MVFILDPEDEDVGPDDWRGEHRIFDPRPEEELQLKIAEFFLRGGVATYIPMHCDSKHHPPIERKRYAAAREQARVEYNRRKEFQTQLQLDDNRRLENIRRAIKEGASSYNEIAQATNLSRIVLKRLEKTYNLEFVK